MTVRSNFSRLGRMPVAMIAAAATIMLFASTVFAQTTIVFDSGGKSKYSSGDRVLRVDANAMFVAAPLAPNMPIIAAENPSLNGWLWPEPQRQLCNPQESCGRVTLSAENVTATSTPGKFTATGLFMVTGRIPAFVEVDPTCDPDFENCAPVYGPDILMNNDGTMLTGDVQSFLASKDSDNLDTFVFTVKLTGGSWLSNSIPDYGESQLVTVTVTSHTSDGFFPNSFNAGAKGYVTPKPPEALICNGTIGDKVWDDINQNGIQDWWFESGLENVPLDLYVWDTATSSWVVPTTGTTSVNTIASGDYLFQNLCPGQYKVQPTTLEGYTPSLSQQGSNPAVDSNAIPADNASPGVVTLVYDSDNQTVDVDLTVDFGFYIARTGAYMTVTQGGWGSKPAGNNPGMRLKNNFAYVYPTSTYPMGVVIGAISGAGCPAAPYRLNFTGASAIQAFLPQGGKPAALNACQPDPTKKLTVLAGQVLALTLNVDFSYTGVTQPGLGMLTAVLGPLAGTSVNQILEIGNCMLSGKAASECPNAPSSLTLSQINDVITKINENFAGGATNNEYLH